MNFIISLNICKWDVHWLYWNLLILHRIWKSPNLRLHWSDCLGTYMYTLSLYLSYIFRSKITQEWHLKFHNTSLKLCCFTWSLKVLFCWTLAKPTSAYLLFSAYLVFCNLHWFKFVKIKYFPPLICLRLLNIFVHFQISIKMNPVSTILN